jgi:hypothetical protein
MTKIRPTWKERYCESGDPRELVPLKNGQQMVRWWRNEHGRRTVVVRCFCGSEREAQWNNAVRSHSCGCMTKDVLRQARTVHGHSRVGRYGSRTWKTWKSVLERCEKDWHKSYADYGGRGIKVCERWHDFQNFLADMGTRPAGLQIDRINNEGHYEPGNCRWVTCKANSRNKRNTVFLEHDGTKDTAGGWAERTGIPYTTIYRRLRNGWDVDRVLTQPRREQRVAA